MHLALEHYSPPTWASTLARIPSKRIRLAHVPTPLHPWPVDGIGGNIELSIKRDDLTGMALSGNKVRKLEFLLAEAVEQGCDTVITCGGLQSNHCRATAVASRQLGMGCSIALRTNDTATDPGMVGNVFIDRVVGADIHLITPAQYGERSVLMRELAGSLRAKGKRPYIIPEGGSNGLGAWGYVEAMRELLGQLEAQHQEVDDIVVACGSGGTAAGLALAVHLSASAFTVHAVNVCDDATYFYQRVNDILEEMQVAVKAEDVLDIIDGYVGDGYAISRDEELDQLLAVATKTGILLDPVYTGKAYAGMLETLSTRPDRYRGNRVLFVHTGGLLGLFDKSDQLRTHLHAGVAT